jgi:aspartyl/asparaginyl-tRNA synthetase
MLVRTLLRGRAMSTGGGVVTCQHITDTLPLHSSLTLRAWVKSVRAQKQAAFIVLNDGSDQHGVQVVCDPAMAKGFV